MRKITEVPKNTKFFISVSETGRLYVSSAILRAFRLQPSQVLVLRYNKRTHRIYLHVYNTSEKPEGYEAIKLHRAYGKVARLHIKPGKYALVCDQTVATFQRLPL